MSRVDDFREAIGAAVAEAMGGPRAKTVVEKFINELCDDLRSALSETADEFIIEAAREAVRGLLKDAILGDEKAFREIINGGEDYRGGAFLYPNGKLIAHGGVATRETLFKTHAELLRTDRIKDLEGMVERLQAELKKRMG